MDTFIFSLEYRNQMYKKIFERFDFFENLHALSISKITKHYGSSVNFYKENKGKVVI